MLSSTPPLDDCLRLLRGERDEQKLAGLLIAANVCRAGDAAVVAEVYRAIGPRFLRRLVNTGLGKVEGGKEEEREAYPRLAVTVLSGLARAPEVAADEGVVSILPLIAEVLSKSSDLTINEECFELLSLVAIASEDGAYKFCEPGVMDMLFLQISSFPDVAPSQTIHESTIMQAITGLNETISLVLDFLQDAKDHGQRKGDDLLAAVRIVGSFQRDPTTEYNVQRLQLLCMYQLGHSFISHTIALSECETSQARGTGDEAHPSISYPLTIHKLECLQELCG